MNAKELGRKRNKQEIRKAGSFFFLFLKVLFIYLRERKRVHRSRGEGVEGEGEADSPLSREPNSRTLRS